MKVLITGVTGFSGGYLARFLSSLPRVEVHGISRHRPSPKLQATFFKKIHSYPCDILEASQVSRLIKRLKPQRIFHLAAQSSVPLSWQDPAKTLSVNILGQLNLFEAVRKHSPRSRIHISGSSEEYGLVLKSEVPVLESQPKRPLTPYGVSKATQDLLAYQYHASYGLDIVRTRAFSYTGPGQPEGFVTSNFAKQVAAIEAGLQKPKMLVGNLESIRDFTDVRDMVRAYWLALEHGKAGEVYNVASGRGIRIRTVLNMFLKNSSVKIRIQYDPGRGRPSDVPILMGNSSKFRKLTGWKNEIPFERTVQDLLDDWRHRL